MVQNKMLPTVCHVCLLCSMEAVYLLNMVVEQCTSDVFSQHCEHWVKALLTILQVLVSVKYMMYSNLHVVVLV